MQSTTSWIKVSYLFVGKTSSIGRKPKPGAPERVSWETDVFDEHYDQEDIYRQDWEVSIGEEEPVIVKGRLREKIQYWKDIGANETILQIIQEGYRIPFLENPLGVFLSNNRSARDHKEFVIKAIQELLSTGRVKEVEKPPHVVIIHSP